MSESVFSRARRIASGSIEELVIAAERSGGTKVMRGAIREIDALVAEARADRDKATARRLQAVRQQVIYAERMADLRAKAEFAVKECRDDLAEAILRREIDFEERAAELVTIESEASEIERKLEEALASLEVRKAQMEEELKAFEAARKDASLMSASGVSGASDVSGKIDRAEAAFNRAMEGASGMAGIKPADVEAIQSISAIEAMQKSSIIARRLDEMKQRRMAS